MKLFRLYETENNKSAFLKGVFLTRELAEEKASKPPKSSHAEYIDDKWIMVPDTYTYSIEEFEWEKDLEFELYVFCSKEYYSPKGKRISGLSWEEAQEMYERYSDLKFVELRLPQKQFKGSSITVIESNRDELYWENKAKWEKDFEDDTWRAGDAPWIAPGMCMSDFI